MTVQLMASLSERTGTFHTAEISACDIMVVSKLIVVVGALNVDFVFRLNTLPSAGETVFGHTFKQLPGGKGGNACSMAARISNNVAMVGSVGGDSFGIEYINNLKKLGVDTTQIKIDASISTGSAGIMVASDTAENIIGIIPAANGLFCPDDIDSANSIFSLDVPGILLCQNEIPRETTLRALQKGRETSFINIFNPSPVSPELDELISNVDILVVNEGELYALTSAPKDTLEGIRDSIKSCFKKYRASGLKTIVCTRGAKGVCWGSASEDKGDVLYDFHELPGHKITPVDSTGAGDAFCGVLGAELAKGNTIDGACKLANRIAALTVEKEGAQASYPTAEEIAAIS